MKISQHLHIASVGDFCRGHDTCEDRTAKHRFKARRQSAKHLSSNDIEERKNYNKAQGNKA